MELKLLPLAPMLVLVCAILLVESGDTVVFYPVFMVEPLA